MLFDISLYYIRRGMSPKKQKQIRQMGLDQVKRPLHSEENYQQNENTNY